LADLDLYRIQTGSATTFNDLLIRIDGGSSIRSAQFRTDTRIRWKPLSSTTPRRSIFWILISTLLTGGDYLAVTLSTLTPMTWYMA
jgi:hypothetical protein